MNDISQENNTLNLELAVNSVKVLHPDSAIEVKICHSLFIRYPNGIGARQLLFTKIDDGNIASFRATIYDLARRGIIKTAVVNGGNHYSMTPEFYEMMASANKIKSDTKMDRIQKLINSEGLMVQCADEIPMLSADGEESYYKRVYAKLDENVECVAKMCGLTDRIEVLTTMVVHGLDIQIDQRKLIEWMRVNQNKLADVIDKN